MNIAPERFIILIFFTCTFSFAQVGINTTSPNGILDINSTSQGVVLPRLALTATTVMAPATNPQTGNIPAGTVVYNTANTNNGLNDVYPGMYVWDGSKWIPQFPLRHYELFEQSNVGNMRTSNGTVAVPGLSSTITAKYTGTYRIVVSTNYGGGYTIEPESAGNPQNHSDGNFNPVAQTGEFTFTFDGTDYIIPAHSFSVSYTSSSNQRYFAIWQEYIAILYVTMVSGDAKSFSMDFEQFANTAMEANGNQSGQNDGRGYVGYDIPCSIEFTYMGEN